MTEPLRLIAGERMDGRQREYRQHRFLGYLQTHDQVGNRAQGERISHLISIGASEDRGGAGDDFAFHSDDCSKARSLPLRRRFQYFTHHEDEELAKAVSEGRKREFVDIWVGTEGRARPARSGDVPQVKTRIGPSCAAEPHREMLEWYRALDLVEKVAILIWQVSGRTIFRGPCTEAIGCTSGEGPFTCFVMWLPKPALFGSKRMPMYC